VITDEGGVTRQLSTVNPQGDDKVTDLNGEVLIELIGSDDFSLSYTIFLIPENQQHQLTNHLAERLPDYLMDICKSNGWKLTGVTISPGYIQWIISVRPIVTTMQIVQEFRSKSNEQIFGEFKNELSLDGQEDFWAQGYLLLYGNHPTENKIIDQYIDLIRDNQKRQNSQGLDALK